MLYICLLYGCISDFYSALYGRFDLLIIIEKDNVGINKIAFLELARCDIVYLDV